MEEKKIDPLFAELLTKALSGDNSKFELISSEGMWNATRIIAHATKKVVKLFKNLVKNSEETYCEQIRAGEQDLEMLLACLQFRVCLDFYEKELETAKDMLREYRAYVTSGHIIKTILGIPRAEEDMVDYRTLPWKLF